MNFVYCPWVENEFKTINFGDKRLTTRFVTVKKSHSCEVKKFG